MTRSHKLLGILLALTVLGECRPASAQTWNSDGLNSIGRTADGIGMLYAGGGTMAFLVVDLIFAFQKKPLPAAAVVPQFMFAATLLLASPIAASQGDHGVSAGLLAAGGTLVAIPVVGFATRGARNRPRAALGLTPTAFTVSGTF